MLLDVFLSLRIHTKHYVFDAHALDAPCCPAWGEARLLVIDRGRNAGAGRCRAARQRNLQSSKIAFSKAYGGRHTAGTKA